MIIEYVGVTNENIEAARHGLAALTTSWGYQPEPAPITTRAKDPATIPDTTKGIDPIAVASLIISVPSAMLAVADITDRIRKRRRANELIEHAQQLKVQQTVARLVCQDRSFDLATLTPDQLLDLIAEESSVT